MNSDTGVIYRTPEEIAAAQERGEPLVEITEAQADLADEIDALPAPHKAHALQQVDPFGNRRYRQKRMRKRIASKSRQRNRARA